MPEYISKGGEWVAITTKATPKETEVKIDVEIVSKDETVTYNELDVNKDGVVDEKDATIASKVLTAIKEKKGRSKKSS